jgi:hypothetical protein
MLVEYGRVVGVLVGVNTADDSDCFGCHAGIRSSVRADLNDRGEPAGRSDRSVTGLLVQAPIRSDPSGG